jgi:hypothetical protein
VVRRTAGFAAGLAAAARAEFDPIKLARHKIVNA